MQYKVVDGLGRKVTDETFVSIAAAIDWIVKTFVDNIPALWIVQN